MSDVQKRNSTDTSLRKGELPLSPGNSGKEGERANGAKDLGKEKGAYGLGRTLLSMLEEKGLWREHLRWARWPMHD